MANMSENIVLQLREVTCEPHAQLTATPFFSAAAQQTLSLESYLGYIRVLAVLHSAVELGLKGGSFPGLEGVRLESHCSTAELLADNDFFRSRLIPDSVPAIDTALEAAAELRLLSQTQPVALIGSLYVLDSVSCNCAQLLDGVTRLVGSSNGGGLSYLTRYSKGGLAEHTALTSALEAWELRSEHSTAVLDTAVRTYGWLGRACTALWPLEGASLRYTVTAFNPESGKHAVHQNRGVLSLVLRTTERCLNEYPYILYRFGSRGRRFTDADGAWISSLAAGGPQAVAAELQWLGRLLAVRGIPRVVLVRHLEILVEELAGAEPAGFSMQQIEVLRYCASELGRSLEGPFPAELRRRYAAQLQAELSLEPGWSSAGFMCEEAVELLCSALVDELDGIEGAVNALLGCLAHPARYSAAWTAALHGHKEALMKNLEQNRGCKNEQIPK